MEYAYDALGRRIRKIDRVANPDETTLYYYNNNWQILAETNAGGTQQRDYIYGNYIDEVLLKTEDGDDLYYAQNHIYSVVALIDDQGNVVERYEYDAYGKPHFYDGSFNSRNQTAYNNVILFCGYRFDEESDKYHIRHRELEPYTGRWLSHDPLGIVPNATKPNKFKIINQYRDGISLYEYVQTDPVNKRDPYGLYYMPWVVTPLNKPKCGICGPDITLALYKLRRELIDTFEGWSEEERKRRCKGMHGGDGWDITTLHEGDISIDGCGTGDCKKSVTVLGNCYSVNEVNYWMWGVAKNLCGNGLYNTLVLVQPELDKSLLQLRDKLAFGKRFF